MGGIAMNRFTAIAVLNIYCAVTTLFYYATLDESILLNTSAVIWYLMFFVNMAISAHVNKGALPRIVAMSFPVVIGFLCVFAVHNSALYWLLAQVSAVIYFAFSAWHAWYLGSDRFDKAPIPLHRIVFIAHAMVFFLVVALVSTYSSRMTIISEMSMRSAISLMSGLVLLFPILIGSIGIGFRRRCMAHRCIKLGQGVTWVLVILSMLTLMPIFAAPSAVDNAERQFVGVFGGSPHSTGLSVPKMVFGYRVDGYSVVFDREYMTMRIAEDGGRQGEYSLKYDMYKSSMEREKTPVVIRIHGSGGDKGSRNLPVLSKSIAANGYTVFDIQYGNESVKPSNDVLAENVATFLNYLYSHRDTLNIDVQRIFVTGASRGGKMTLKTIANWSGNKYFDLRHKVRIVGGVIYWGFMEDLFDRSGDEKIIDLNDLSEDFPPILCINTTNDGSIQGGYLLKGALLQHGVKVANIELKHAMHSADAHYYGPWGQMSEHYTLRFMNYLTQNKEESN